MVKPITNFVPLIPLPSASIDLTGSMHGVNQWSIGPPVMDEFETDVSSVDEEWTVDASPEPASPEPETEAEPEEGFDRVLEPEQIEGNFVKIT